MPNNPQKDCFCDAAVFPKISDKLRAVVMMIATVDDDDERCSARALGSNAARNYLAFVYIV